MLGTKRTSGRALGTKYDKVDLLGAKMVVHGDGKENKAPPDAKKPKLEK